ncbi:DUF3999 domain-containing protein [Trinickia caryophylli]|nr:DUF3999 domain-containing protein [Trinickia caryophylli]TRX20422.1 DUF3999 domain-containing protein [Trinickia caryophylli]
MVAWALSGLTLSPAAVCSAADAFAHRFALTLDGPAAYYTLAVPPSVYAASRSEDLSDVRIFNGAGEPVPYSLDAPRAPAAAPTLRDLKWFSLPQAAVGSEGAPAGVSIGQDGTLRFLPSAPQRGAAGHGMDLVDLGARPGRIAALRVRLHDVRFQGRVRVEASDDLRGWRPLGDTSLLKVERGGDSLVQDRIPIDLAPGRYVRLQWLDAAPEIEAMQAEVLAEGEPAPPHARAWRENVTSRAGDEPGEYRFETGGAYPVDRVTFALPQANTVVHAAVYSRPGARAPWREVAQGLLFRLAQGASEQRNAPLELAPDTDREWRLVVDARNGGLGGGVPAVSFGWQPASLTFVARGAPPFTLAVGNGRLRSAAQARDELVVTPAAAIAAASVGAPLPVSAKEARDALAGDGTAARPYVLWGALVLAVAVLAAIAWRLLRQREDGADR